MYKVSLVGEFKMKWASAVKTQVSKEFKNEVLDKNFISTINDVERPCYI
jgi:hypothetical protein